MRVLLTHGADVTETAPTGTSSLVVAAHSGHTALAMFLLERGADPNAADAGYTALHAAILRGDHELLNALLAHEADPNTRLLTATPARRLGRDWAMDWTWIGATPFWMAAMFTDASMMRHLAEAGAVPILTMEDGTTPLMAPLSVSTRAAWDVVTPSHSLQFFAHAGYVEFKCAPGINRREARRKEGFT